MCIWCAAWAGHLDTVQRVVGREPHLLNAKEAISDTYSAAATPLIHAARMGHVEIVRWLADRGAALDERDSRGDTALSLASHPRGAAAAAGGGRPHPLPQPVSVDSPDSSIR
jgi:hypothetical protein